MNPKNSVIQTRTDQCGFCVFSISRSRGTQTRGKKRSKWKLLNFYFLFPFFLCTMMRCLGCCCQTVPDRPICACPPPLRCRDPKNRGSLGMSTCNHRIRVTRMCICLDLTSQILEARTLTNRDFTLRRGPIGVCRQHELILCRVDSSRAACHLAMAARRQGWESCHRDIRKV